MDGARISWKGLVLFAVVAKFVHGQVQIGIRLLGTAAIAIRNARRNSSYKTANGGVRQGSPHDPVKKMLYYNGLVSSPVPREIPRTTLNVACQLSSRCIIAFSQ